MLATSCGAAAVPAAGRPRCWRSAGMPSCCLRGPAMRRCFVVARAGAHLGLHCVGFVSSGALGKGRGGGARDRGRAHDTAHMYARAH
eukprot:365246-Chlamydomonas_euryale.AAC.8